MQPQRIVGVVHRVKRTKEDENRPTMVAILNPSTGATHAYELETETDELDWLAGRFPTRYEKVDPDPDPDSDQSQFLGSVLDRQLRRKKPDRVAITKLKEQIKTARAEVSKQLDAKNAPEVSRLSAKEEGLKNLLAEAEEGLVSHVPVEFDGLKPGDHLVMTLGGSGDYLAHAAQRQAQKIGARVSRIKPFDLKVERGGDASKKAKAEDHLLLARLASERPDLFTPMTESDLSQIEVGIVFRRRQEVMRDRIACGQRILKRLIGETFVTANLAPEKSLADLYEEVVANDAVYQAILSEEEKCNRELARLVEAQPVYEQILDGVEGVGVRIAAPILARIGNIGRFATVAKFKKFCGVHVMADGRFPRRREGELASWSPELRQTFYLLGDQFNRRPGSVWGQKLLEYKAKFRAKYPEAVQVPKLEKGKPVLNPDGSDKLVRRYGDGHIHRMATWRTITRFAEWLYREWSRLSPETGSVKQDKAA